MCCVRVWVGFCVCAIFKYFLFLLDSVFLFDGTLTFQICVCVRVYFPFFPFDTKHENTEANIIIFYALQCTVCTCMIFSYMWNFINRISPPNELWGSRQNSNHNKVKMHSNWTECVQPSRCIELPSLYSHTHKQTMSVRKDEATENFQSGNVHCTLFMIEWSWRMRLIECVWRKQVMDKI